jgi:hypothetical protein
MKQRILAELEEGITNVLTNIPGNMLRSAVANMTDRSRKCANNVGVYAEI